MTDKIASDDSLVNHFAPAHAHSADDCHPLAGDWLEARVRLAKQTCLAQGVRFTPLREQVYRLILQAAQPLGAYDLLAQLQTGADKPIAPPTVYRSLDFLLQQGFIHQLSSTKAFFACCQPDGQHTATFLICQHCGEVREFNHQAVQGVLQQTAQQANFLVQTSVVELLGRCQHCQSTQG